MPIIFYNGKKRIVRYTKEDKQLIISLGKRFRRSKIIKWTEARETKEFKTCWFADLVNSAKALSQLHSRFTRSHKKRDVPPVPKKSYLKSYLKSMKLTHKIYTEASPVFKPEPKTIWDKSSWNILKKLTKKYRRNYFINWKALSKDLLFLTLPVQDIVYLRRYYNTTVRNNKKDMVEYRRKKALEYKIKNKVRYRELQKKRAHNRVVAVSEFLRDEARKQGKFIRNVPRKAYKIPVK